ncbi:MAG: amidohydrolase family protein [Propionibacteriaceae bacterium]
MHIAGAPTVDVARDGLVSVADGVVVVGPAGTIVYSGAFGGAPDLGGVPVRDLRGCFLLPGFVDTHLHYPQTAVTDAYGGGQLMEWLEHCVYPAEAKLAEPGYAALIAAAFVARRVAVGTTAAMVFGSAFPAAQRALFAAHEAAGLRVVSGRGIQTVGPASASALITGEAEAVELVRAEIAAWHDPAGLRQVAIMPRFSLSVTRQTLTALGELYAEMAPQGVYVHSHLNENNRPGDGEIASVRAAYDVATYLDTYDGKFLAGSQIGGESLLGRRTILAHAVHCTDAELARMAATGTSIAHCPTSQLFLGSGTMPWRRTVDAGVTVALGTDVGAGDEWLLSRVANDCYKQHLGEAGAASVALHPAELLFTATLAGARALDQEGRFGNLDAGKEADFLVVDPDAYPPLALTLQQATGTDHQLFALLMGLREPAIREVYVAGRQVRAAHPGPDSLRDAPWVGWARRQQEVGHERRRRPPGVSHG